MLETGLKRFIVWYEQLSREAILLGFFSFLVIVLIVRLFFLQVVESDYYQGLLLNQHYTSSELDAERGQVYITDRAGKRLQLTENVTLFNLYVDPKFIYDKERVIEVLTPIVYTHLCEIHGLETPDKETCVKNIESFSRETILPERDGVFVTSGDAQYYVDNIEYQNEVAEAVSGFSLEEAQDHIADRLDLLIRQGMKERNYLGFFDTRELLDELSDKERFPYITIESTHYVYVTPTEVASELQAARELQELLVDYGHYRDVDSIRTVLVPQEIRYVKLLSDMNAKVAKMIKDAKTEFFDEKERGVPLLHGLGLEEYQVRYYPFGGFMANVIGYVDQNDQAHYGVEEYFDEELAGDEGKIIGLATPWIGQVGSNDFEIEQPKDGVDIFLTIDPVIQKEVEEIARYYHDAFGGDSIAVTVLDPHSGKVKGLVNYPTFDLNRAQEAYKLKPMTYDERYIVDDLTFSDIPVFVVTGDELRQAYSFERTDPNLQKYIFRNMLGPQVFVDKNIGFPYEPGSIFKAITLGIGIDSDSLSMFDFYNDPGSVKVGPYTIANINSECEGDNTFLHALEYSCNVGMVRIAQRMTKYVFYAYLEKLGFGEKTGVELAGEEMGTLPDFNTVSVARFFNNTFGQGMLATPLQMAVAYGSLVNGGYRIQPTIVEAIYDVEKEGFREIAEKQRKKVFKSETSKQLKEALVSVINEGNLKSIGIPGYSLGGKTGTSEISYKGEYQGGAGWTNGSFVGMVTADTTNYVVSIQVRRPRSSPWGADTAGRVFSDIAQFLISYDNIES